jgi:hypothetical protein
VTVVRFLAEKAGVPPQRMVASGYGEWSPIATNKSGTGRARNRRIEILLTPTLAPKVIARGKLEQVAKADAKADAKSEAKSDTKADTKKTDAKPETKPEPKAVAQKAAHHKSKR